MPKHSLYRILIRLYPRNFRAKYRAQLLQTLDDMLEAAPSKAHRIRIEMKELMATPAVIVREHDYVSAGKIRLTSGVFLLITYIVLILAHEGLERYGIYTFAGINGIMPLIGGIALVGTFAGAVIPLSFNDYKSTWYMHGTTYILATAQLSIAAYVVLHLTGILH